MYTVIDYYVWMFYSLVQRLLFDLRLLDKILSKNKPWKLLFQWYKYVKNQLLVFHKFMCIN